MANEEATAVRFITELLDQCSAAEFATVNLFAVLDKANTDNTLAILRELEMREPRLQVVWAPENRCVVDAYIRGYRQALAAGCDWILEIDAGYSHQPTDVPRFFATMARGYDCVFGSRFCDGGSFQGPLSRRIVSYGGTLLSNLLLGTRLKDMTSGFQLFSRGALEQVLETGINSRANFFQTEIRAHCRKLQITEVPIRYLVTSDSLKRAVLSDAARNLGHLFKLRLARRL